MKNIAKVLSVVVFGMSISLAHAAKGEGADNVQHTKTYQQFISSNSSASADSIK